MPKFKLNSTAKNVPKDLQERISQMNANLEKSE
jgi:hypothetical protein